MPLSIDAMRKIDRLVGIPLCFAATLLKKSHDLVFPRSGEGSCTKVLFIGLSEKGSMILAEPAVRKIYDHLGTHAYFTSFSENMPIIQLLGTIPSANIFSIRTTSLAVLIADSARFAVWARKQKIDTVIDLELFSRCSALLSWISGARRVAGFHAFHAEGLYRGDFLTRKVAYNPHQHMAKNFMALANAVLSERVEVPFCKTVITDEETAVQKTTVTPQSMSPVLMLLKNTFPSFAEGKQKVVILNTNASDLVPLRRWPKASYIRLGRMIIDQVPEALIVLIGVESESEWNETIRKSIGSDRCANFAGKTAIVDLPSLFAASACMVSNDSGPAHFAALTTLPTFVLFGPETPALYGPLGNMTPLYAGLACSPCVSAANHRRSPCRDNVCLQIITPETVFEKILPVLNHSEPEVTDDLVH